jgi:hypothetical protein
MFIKFLTKTQLKPSNLESQTDTLGILSNFSMSSKGMICIYRFNMGQISTFDWL